ncbi:MAG TPA: NUDIX hydrolase [Herpetosiphonaceae bacterium]|nr:NUDIX hydrolase [Herpetosiphonaceae bacterium]
MSEAKNWKIQPWRVEQSDEIENYRIFKLRREVASSPNGEKRAEFYVLDSPDWVNVIPVTPRGEIVMVGQYRHGSRQISLETPAGLIEPHESVEDAATRELREETGYTAQRYTLLGSTLANPAFMTNRFTAVLAEDVMLTDPTKWDEHEELEIKLVPVDDVPDMLARGDVVNSFAALALSWFLLHRHNILPATGSRGTESA